MRKFIRNPYCLFLTLALFFQMEVKGDEKIEKLKKDQSVSINKVDHSKNKINRELSLAALNSERVSHNFNPIKNIEEVDLIIQDELDQRLEKNIQNKREGKTLLPEMPISETWAIKNKMRTERRLNLLKSVEESEDLP